MPTRREEPASSEYSAPHWQCFEGAKHLLKVLEDMCAAADQKAATDPMSLMDGAIERQAVSEAVQVFAAMAVEGAVNLYCLHIFGETAMTRRFLRLTVAKKLKHALPEATQNREEVLKQLAAIARELADARNKFVHPSPTERIPPVTRGRRGDLESARTSVSDVVEFVRILRAADHRNAFMLSFMLLPKFSV